MTILIIYGFMNATFQVPFDSTQVKPVERNKICCTYCLPLLPVLFVNPLTRFTACVKGRVGTFNRRVIDDLDLWKFLFLADRSSAQTTGP